MPMGLKSKDRIQGCESLQSWRAYPQGLQNLARLSIPQTWEECGPDIKDIGDYVHLQLLRECPVGRGSINLREFVELLQAQCPGSVNSSARSIAHRWKVLASPMAPLLHPK